MLAFTKHTANFNHGFLRGRDGSFTVIDFPGAVFRPFESKKCPEEPGRMISRRDGVTLWEPRFALKEALP